MPTRRRALLVILLLALVGLASLLLALAAGSLPVSAADVGRALLGDTAGVAAEVVLDCSGEWARIRFADYHRQGDERIIAGFLTGWVRGICGSQRTTCDGLVGDRP